MYIYIYIYIYTDTHHDAGARPWAVGRRGGRPQRYYNNDNINDNRHDIIYYNINMIII